MVEVQFGARQAAIAVLTRIAVACEDIEARESHMTLRHSLVGGKYQHARHADKAIDDSEALMLDLDREVAPAIEIESPVLLIDRLCHTLIEQRERSLDRSDVDGQIRAIENQYPAIQQVGSQRWGRSDR